MDENHEYSRGNHLQNEINNIYLNHVSLLDKLLEISGEIMALKRRGENDVNLNREKARIEGALILLNTERKRLQKILDADEDLNVNIRRPNIQNPNINIRPNIRRLFDLNAEDYQF
jgi:hypothetical protein